MKNDVFISYSKNDKATADAICRALEAHQLRCWYAPRNISSGADWDASIMEALANSRVMILVWSAKSDKSKQVKREVAIALDDVGITLIPFRVEEIVSPKLRYYLGNIQWLDASVGSLEESLQRLVEQVKASLPQETEPIQDAAAEAARKLERQLAEENRQLEEVEAREREEAEARQREEAEARQREEAEARQRKEAETRQREEAEARQREEAEARQREEAEARRLKEARQREEAEARQRRQLEEARQRKEAEEHDRELLATRTAAEFPNEEPKYQKFPLRRVAIVAIPLVAFLVAVAGLAYAFWPVKHDEPNQPSPDGVASNQTPTPAMMAPSPTATTENKSEPTPATPTPTPRKIPSPERSPNEGASTPSPAKPSPTLPRAPISGGVLNGKAISLQAPMYPPMARAARASGTVVVQVTIDETGDVISAHAVSGHPLLHAASVAAARESKFSPTKLRGQPVKVTGVITFRFVEQ